MLRTLDAGIDPVRAYVLGWEDCKRAMAESELAGEDVTERARALSAVLDAAEAIAPWPDPDAPSPFDHEHDDPAEVWSGDVAGFDGVGLTD